MAPPTEPPPTNDIEVRDETTVTRFAVQGTLPAGLSGRLLGIGPDSDSDAAGPRSRAADDGVVHSVHLHGGRVISYRIGDH